VATALGELSNRCRRCGAELPASILACAECHALVHAAELQAISAKALELESKSDFQSAITEWNRAFLLLPRDVAQASWIHALLAELQSAFAERTRTSAHPWVKKLGPLGPIAILLAKSKVLITALFNLKFLISLGAFMAFYWTLYGAKFGVGFAILILIHEMGHFIDVKRRGLPAEMPVFLPGLGAYVRWQALGVSAETRAEISLAGPMAGWLASVACAIVWWKTGSPLWSALARAGAWLNALNLIPVWVLDGGQAANSLSRASRLLLVTVCLALWLFLHENVFFLIAAGGVYRLFTKDLPADPSSRIAAYYLAVLMLLAVILRILPGHGFGPA